MKKDWSKAYGKDADRYDVRDQTYWAVGKRVLLYCGDMFSSPGQQMLAMAPKDFLMVDPPWNKGLHKSYFTKIGQEETSTDFEVLLDAICDLASEFPRFAIEIGSQKLKGVLSRVPAGAKVQNITYMNQRPCFMVTSGSGIPDLSDLDDIAATKKVVQAADRHVFDPCMGQGLSIEAGLVAGKTVSGIELNPRRASVALAKAASILGEEPVELAGDAARSLNFRFQPA